MVTTLVGGGGRPTYAAATMIGDKENKGENADKAQISWDRGDPCAADCQVSLVFVSFVLIAFVKIRSSKTKYIYCVFRKC